MNKKLNRLGNRIFGGLAMATFGGIIAFTTDNTLLDLGGALFIIEGAGDIISGDHHYVSSRVIKYFSREKINITYEGNKYAK